MRDNRCWLTQRTRARKKKKGRELKKQNATGGERMLLASVVARGKSCFLTSRRNGKQLLFERDRITAVTRRAVLAAAKAVAAATLPDDRRRCPRAIFFFPPQSRDLSLSGALVFDVRAGKAGAGGTKNAKKRKPENEKYVSP